MRQYLKSVKPQNEIHFTQSRPPLIHNQAVVHSNTSEILETMARPEDETAAPATTAQTSPAEIVVNVKVWTQIAKSFLYVEVSSLVLMFACVGIWSESSYVKYALSVAVVSLLACLIMQTGEFVKPGFFLSKFENPVSLFLFFWWAIGTGIITFKGPFLTASNGYFAAWIGLFSTAHWALHIDTAQFTELDTGRKTLLVFGTAAAVVMLACITYFRTYPGQSGWGFTAGLLTVFVCAALFKVSDDASIQVLKVTAVLLFATWSIVAGICTFGAPFLAAGKAISMPVFLSHSSRSIFLNVLHNGPSGNGYFGCWAGFVASTYFLNHVMTLEDDIV
jgi:hypothetical protein